MVGDSWSHLHDSAKRKEKRMNLQELEGLIDLPRRRLKRVLRELGCYAKSPTDPIDDTLLPWIENHEDVFRSTVVNDSPVPSLVPPLSFLSFAPYQHLDFTRQSILLWKEMSRAATAQFPLYTNLLSGTLLEGLLLLGLHAIQEGPDLFQSPTLVYVKVQNEHLTLSWLIQLAAVNEMFDNPTRIAFHRIREMRNDVHFLARRDKTDFLRDGEDAYFVVRTLAEFVPRLRDWIKSKRLAKQH